MEPFRLSNARMNCQDVSCVFSFSEHSSVAVMLVSRGESGPKPEPWRSSKDRQVGSPLSVRNAHLSLLLLHRGAIGASDGLPGDLVTADMADAAEFPKPVHRCGVRRVLHAVIYHDASIRPTSLACAMKHA